MIPSIYNNIIYVEDKHTVIYNALNDKFVIIKDNFFSFKSCELNRLREREHRLYQNFVDAGVIVRDDYDEVGVLKSRLDELDNNDDGFILHINPTIDCNFNCWYCYENHKQRSEMTPNTIDSVKKFIQNRIDRNKNLKWFQIGFFGGEPLLKFDKVVVPIIKYAKAACEKADINLSINFTTNGSLLNAEMIENLSKYNCGMQITLDGDKETHDKTRFWKGGKGSYDIILKNVEELTRHGIRVILRINFTSKNIKGIDGIMDDILKFPEESLRNLSVDLQRVWQDRPAIPDETEEIATELREKLSKHRIAVHRNYLLQQGHKSCYGDKRNHVLINYNGEVFGCTARDFNHDNSMGNLEENGEIKYEEEKKLLWDTAKFSKPVCRKCRIAPMCGGGCRQQAVDHHDSPICHYNYTEEDKDRFVMDLFQFRYC